MRIFKITNSITHLLFSCFFVLCSLLVQSQQNSIQNNYYKSENNAVHPYSFKELKEHNISIQIRAGIQPLPPIKTFEGDYHLQSTRQTSFSAGFNYQINRDSLWEISTGIDVILNRSHYFLHIPDEDLKGFLSTGGAPQIENKEVF